VHKIIRANPRFYVKNAYLHVQYIVTCLLFFNFCKKNSLKSFYIVIICKPKTLTRWEFKGKINGKNIRKNSCKNPKQLKSRIRIRKKHSGSTTLDP
jgi:hypothetical protein